MVRPLRSRTAMRFSPSVIVPVLAVCTSLASAPLAHADPGPPPATSTAAPSVAGLAVTRASVDPADLELARRPEISGDRAAAGVVTATVVGFGLGQAVEGRWHDTGWIYTVGESLSLMILASGVASGFQHCLFVPDSSCAGANQLALAGLIGMGAFHLAGIIDAAVAPSVHNRHVREARGRVGWARVARVAPYVAPTSHGSTVGLTLSF
jgi:hypothetical protein